jgi:hypothetical protein
MEVVLHITTEIELWIDRVAKIPIPNPQAVETH